MEKFLEADDMNACVGWNLSTYNN